MTDSEGINSRDNSHGIDTQAYHDFLGELVDSSWTRLQYMLDEQRQNICAVAAAVPRALADSQAECLHSFRKDIAVDIEPIAAAVASFSARPIVSAFLRPLCRAHRTAILLWWDEISHVIASDNLTTPQLAYFFRDTRWKRGVLLPAFQHVSPVMIQYL
jgi:hypothetical protein